MICSVKHAKPNVPMEDWKCPKCGTGTTYLVRKYNPETKSYYEDLEQGFVVEESAEGAWECELLHEEDELYCFCCNTATSGKKYAAWYRKQKDLIPCPHCKGTGLIKND